MLVKRLFNLRKRRREHKNKIIKEKKNFLIFENHPKTKSNFYDAQSGDLDYSSGQIQQAAANNSSRLRQTLNETR